MQTAHKPSVLLKINPAVEWNEIETTTEEEHKQNKLDDCLKKMKIHFQEFETLLSNRRLETSFHGPYTVEQLSQKEELLQKHHQFLQTFLDETEPNFMNRENEENLSRLLKWLSIQEYGYNIYQYWDIRDIEKRFDDTLNRRISTEDQILSAYLKLEKAKVYLDMHSMGHNCDEIDEVMMAFDEMTKENHPMFYERDGFGFHMFSFAIESGKLVVRYTDEYNGITLEGTNIFDLESALGPKSAMLEFGNEVAARLKEYLVSVKRTNLIFHEQDPDKIEVRSWFAFENDISTLHLVFEQRGSHVTEHYHKSHTILFPMKYKDGLVYRENGNQIFNIDTIVREFAEEILENELDYQKRCDTAFKHFVNTLSTQDVLADNYAVLSGETYDFIILFSNNKQSGSIHRIQKGLPLTQENIKELCIHPQDGNIPRFDGFATISMMLKAKKEAMVNSIANTFGCRRFNQIQNALSLT